jgi:hypothetical protein
MEKVAYCRYSRQSKPPKRERVQDVVVESTRSSVHVGRMPPFSFPHLKLQSPSSVHNTQAPPCPIFQVNQLSCRRPWVCDAAAAVARCSGSGISHLRLSQRKSFVWDRLNMQAISRSTLGLESRSCCLGQRSLLLGDDAQLRLSSPSRYVVLLSLQHVSG